MKKQESLHPAVPECSSTFLQGLASALSARAKAIRYSNRSFKCTREVDDDGLEVLKISLFERTRNHRRAVVDFCFWEDGAMSVVAGVSNPKQENGWCFSHSASGFADALEPDAIVSRFEKTVAETVNESLVDEGQQQLSKLWVGVELEFHGSSNK